MGSPIGHGVFKAVEAHRRKARGYKGPRPIAGEGWWCFVIATLALSWVTAGMLGARVPAADEPLSSRLLWASIYYAATMGWQPLVAAWLAKQWRKRPSTLNGGMRLPRY